MREGELVGRVGWLELGVPESTGAGAGRVRWIDRATVVELIGAAAGRARWTESDFCELVGGTAGRGADRLECSPEDLLCEE